jgi:hypothetical protein
VHCGQIMRFWGLLVHFALWAHSGFEHDLFEEKSMLNRRLQLGKVENVGMVVNVVGWFPEQVSNLISK